MARAFEVFARFLRLGCTSFGGPVAHLGYFRREFVESAGWLDDDAFAEIVALCSVLPGPTSSQVGMCLGFRRAGPAGALLAWLAFTTPSALLMGGFGLALRATSTTTSLERSTELSGALEGLAAAAAAVVFGAVLQLGRSLVRTRAQGAIAAGSVVLALAAGRYAPGLLWLVLVAGGVAGAAVDRGPALPRTAPPLVISRRVGAVAGCALMALLAGLPIVTDPAGYSGLFATFFRAGALVFGGGHVVLPFLLGLIGPDRVPGRIFFAGYGAAPAMPGPLFTFAAFLGAVDRRTGGAAGALVALLGIFSPSFLLLAAAVPLWGALRALPRAGAALTGLGAAVVGLLAAAFVNPIALGLLRDPRAAALAAVAFASLALRAPPWAVVVAVAVAGAALETIIPAHASG